MQDFRSRVFLFILLFTTSVAGYAKSTQAQGVAVSTSPSILATIHNAHTIFLVNGGANSTFASDMIGSANGSYTQLYAALQTWGRFQLVDTPAKADLIFEIVSSEHYDFDGETETDKKGRTSVSGSSTRFASFHLSLYGPKMTPLLWETDAPAGYASSKSKGAVAFTNSINNLLGRVKLLAATADSTPTPTTTQR